MTTGDQSWFEEHYGERHARNVTKFLTFDTRLPELDPLVRHQRARERAHRARDHLARDVARAERVLPDGQ